MNIQCPKCGLRAGFRQFSRKVVSIRGQKPKIEIKYRCLSPGCAHVETITYEVPQGYTSM